jgi:hypothetical protein
MKLAFAAFVLMGFGATAASGQTLSQPQQSYGAGAMSAGMVRTGGPQNSEANATPAGQPRSFTLCPASMDAQHLADGNVVKARSAHPNPHQTPQAGGAGQWLHLTLIPRDAKPIAKATFTIRGYSAKGRMTGTQSTHSEEPSGAKFDVERTMTVPFTGNKDGSDSADLLVPGMTAVGQIELTSIAYVDGMRWNIATDAGCRVTPDPFMLISSR